MSYVDSQLLPGEKVRYRARIHKLMFLGPALLALFAVILMIVIARANQGGPIGFIFFLISLGWFLIAFISYKTSEFAVTNKRVMIKIGWIRRRIMETMLSKVEAIGVEQGIMGRMLDYGSITVTGTGGTKEPFQNIANPLEFRRQVQGAISTDEEGRAVSAPAGATFQRVERDCPYCAERILARAKVCKHCGRDVSPTAIA